MTDLNHQNLSFYRCTVFIRELFQRGVRHIVISPGSRSTPLTLAAAAHPYIKKHVILDERSAAFTALGIGKATGMPAVLICTSGTAAANYFPAVIEAFESGVPLIVATADRPPELRNTDANQTIDQTELYGNFVLEFRDISEPTGSDLELNTFIDNTGKIIERSLTEKGPIHLNFHFSKPLEPEKSFLEEIEAENKSLAQKTEKHIDLERTRSADQEAELYPLLENAMKPLVIIGQLPVGISIDPIYHLAENLNAPVLSESGYQNHSVSIQGYEGFLRNREIVEELSPDLILRLGLQPASKSLLNALDYWKPDHHIYFTIPPGRKETSLPVTHTFRWNGNDFTTEPLTGGRNFWLDQWDEASKKYLEYKSVLRDSYDVLTDGHVYEHISRQIPKGWWIFYSNSFPARDRSMFGQWKGQTVYTNRGASGIDGITSTNIGIGLSSSDPGILFTGDLAFLHDTNALLNSRLLSKPLVIVILNNNGGSIFRMLPIADHKKYFNDYFETPQQVEISTLCKSHHVSYQKIESIKQFTDFELGTFINESNSSLHVVECVTDPEASMKFRKQLWQKE
ncbi:2-succinyl-5-enolpyruvyl-6-hydroxy-3-cyclohexene-1-carboxylic-acid synthase [Balneolaceae bacterium YR4-1]|uniref:2-succinyl-5-enolpyruvyl-6-hydroxy-3-cyclohexene-1-carboxylate synthase n=1 Tax=Halalkalibaculum roseum TaxID=2709311 RepID=A0A6M1SV27_9BACT|nr:2-succinyl-5-enolpyruvyl-6-hydroxy-3-cyclohexene-1-carboxylic-acid synthase [Halalkalibaculum roseum]NGP76810.1 2-succinyl-5-enolpyruvyl-6-hydroxy-3-cyclohexene-1-carboxylic-acid synthase [Halalkalibaculum roseum]